MSFTALKNSFSGAARPSERRAVFGSDAPVLSSIYDDDVNLTVWNREVSEEVAAAADQLVTADRGFQLSLMTSPETVAASLRQALPDQAEALLIDISELVDMFAYLFDMKRVGLRLTVLEGAMCPKFHVDKVPCRLITTYLGSGTEWLPHSTRNRSILGPSTPRQLDNSAVTDEVDSLPAGAVAMLKGEAWEGNEGFGLIHRSPSVSESEGRLLLTLDFGR